MATQEQIKVEDKVSFRDEHGTEQTSTVSRIAPKGECYKDQEAYIIRGSYGSYIRKRSEISKA